ncbi:MAG TPA: hypothetical protein VFY96_04245, partial [Candidatus Binatia bacterium]|nr:hypothetical protein [Candidatus Binatia bacterium]
MKHRILPNNKFVITWREISAAVAAIRKSFRPSRMSGVRRKGFGNTLESSMDLADIGKTFRRLDYETKVTGRAQYLADMSLPGMCHGKILRSPYPHARIK